MRFLALLGVLAACTVSSSAPEIVIPGSGLVGPTEAVDLEGLDGWPRGGVSFRGWEGRYTRNYRTVSANAWNEQRFDGSFHLTRSEADAVGICAMREGTIERSGPLIGLSYDLPILGYTYDCELEAGGRAGRLQIGAVVTSTFAPSADRRGYVYLDGGPVLEVRSLHQLDAVPLRSATPWGYGLFLDGQAVGMVDLTGSHPVLRLPPAGTPLSDTAELSGLALAMLITE